MKTRNHEGARRSTKKRTGREPTTNENAADAGLRRFDSPIFFVFLRAPSWFRPFSRSALHVVRLAAEAVDEGSKLALHAFQAEVDLVDAGVLLRLQAGTDDGFVPSGGIESGIVTPDILMKRLDVRGVTSGERAQPLLPRPSGK